jgi:hypothetical protein
MTVATKRVASGLMAVALVAGAAGCSGSVPDSASGAAGPGAGKGAAGPERNAFGAVPGKGFRLIGDGSTSFTGNQPKQPVPLGLAPGQKPPQFVVFSWDDVGGGSQELFFHFREVGRKNRANMTYFLSGVYMLPEEKRELYDPPRHNAGSSDIGFNDIEGIRDTLTQIRGAWQDGDEIGTHFNGHFCGPDGGAGTWSVAEWKREIGQAKSFVKNWRTNVPDLADEKPLPFDYDTELVGGRTPCLEGQKNMVAAARTMGFRYDSSGVGNQVWPKKKGGVWDLSLQLVPVPGQELEKPSTGYDFMSGQSGTTTPDDPDQYQQRSDRMRDGLIQAFDRAYVGNRRHVHARRRGDH